MGYEGKVLGTPPTSICKIPRRAMELVPEAAGRIVNEGTDFMMDQVKINTPKSEPPSVPGWPYVPGGDGIHLRDEIHRTELVEVAPDIYEAKVGSDKAYVIYLEEGTGLWGPKHAKYLIEPHNPGGLLVWPGRDGKLHAATHVWHPGSPGQHMFLIGGSITDMSMDEIRRSGDEVLTAGMV